MDKQGPHRLVLGCGAMPPSRKMKVVSNCVALGACGYFMFFPATSQIGFLQRMQSAPWYCRGRIAVCCHFSQVTPVSPNQPPPGCR